MHRDIFERATAAADFVRRQLSHTPCKLPRVAIVLGSGLGAVANAVEHPVIIPYAEIPHFPQPTVEGHSGRLLIGDLAGVTVAVMQGRVHGYEGCSPLEVTFPIRMLGLLEIETVIVTNAAGGIRPTLKQGELVLISDHINLTGSNPLVGANDPRLGPRFFDMTEAYSRPLRALATASAAAAGFQLTQGVYLAVSGPSYETPAEIRAFRTLGADLVGMSTVHEVIVARHMGIEVLGLSCVTNMAAGVIDAPINHEEVMQTGERVQARLTRLLTAILPQLPCSIQQTHSSGEVIR